MSENTFTVSYLNADNSGFAQTIEVKEGTTFGDFFKARKPGESSNSYIIRVRRNGEVITPTEGSLVQSNDKVSIYAKKQEGARQTV